MVSSKLYDNTLERVMACQKRYYFMYLYATFGTLVVNSTESIFCKKLKTCSSSTGAGHMHSKRHYDCTECGMPFMLFGVLIVKP